MITLDYYELAVFALVLGLSGLLVLLIRRERRHEAADAASNEGLRRNRQAQAEFATATETVMGDLKNSVEGLATCMANLDLRMRAVDQRQRQLEDMSRTLVQRRGFDAAKDLLQQGATSHRIAEQCAMPLAEVELLKRLGGTEAAH